MSKSNVNPNHYKVAGRERQGEDIVQERHRQKHAQSLARARSEPHARLQQPVSVLDQPTPGTVRKRSAKRVPRTARANQQGADKRGKRSTAQKRAASGHDSGPGPDHQPGRRSDRQRAVAAPSRRMG
jgi:hypothetical protein